MALAMSDMVESVKARYAQVQCGRPIKGGFMTLPKNPSIRPLDESEALFIEVLLDRFVLTRRGPGVRLDVEFDGRTPAVWNRSGVRHARRAISGFKPRSAALQAKLDDFLLHRSGRRMVVEEPGFPFRYASGGTLPVIRAAGHDYYCLFYRDIAPVGWNIANGGCSSRSELRYPIMAAERELREEVVILDRRNRRRYVFAGDVGKPSDLPEFASARQVWSDRLALEIDKFRECQIPLKWLAGPDQVCVKLRGSPITNVDGCFLNINALDFGIEIDRIAKLSIDEDAVIIDGELAGDEPINQIVGLFEVTRLNRELAVGTRRCTPDRCFWDGHEFQPSHFEQVLNQGYFRQSRFRGATESRREYRLAREKLDLCPVTRRIIARYIGLGNQVQPIDRNVGVFISHPSEDARAAKCVYEWCANRGLDPFLSEESINQSNFGAAIDNALDCARHMIVVAGQPERLLKQWVQFEWRRFQGDILNGRKPHAQLIPFISGFEPRDLPGALREHNAVVFHPNRPRLALPRLERYLP